MCDENFVALNAVEIATNDDDTPEKKARIRAGVHAKSAHFNFIAKTQTNLIQPTYNPDYDWLHTEEEKKKVQSHLPNFNRHHNTEDFNKVIDIANANGFFSIYNHPLWSLHDFRDYEGLENLFAVEIFNTSGFMSGLQSEEHVYSELLNLGKQLFCVSGDDNHIVLAEDDPRNEECKNFVMIQAEELTYSGVIKALEEGAFYTSQGPEIFDVEVVGNLLKIKCSPVVKIVVEGRYTPRVKKVAYPKKVGEKIQCAEFFLTSAEKDWFYIHITDEYTQILSWRLNKSSNSQ